MLSNFEQYHGSFPAAFISCLQAYLKGLSGQSISGLSTGTLVCKYALQVVYIIELDIVSELLEQTKVSDRDVYPNIDCITELLSSDNQSVNVASVVQSLLWLGVSLVVCEYQIVLKSENCAGIEHSPLWIYRNISYSHEPWRVRIRTSVSIFAALAFTYLHHPSNISLREGSYCS